MDLSDPKTWTDGAAVVIGAPHIVVPLLIACVTIAWWFRGFLHKERVQVLKDQLTQAQRDADTFSARFERAEAKFAELQKQITAHAPAAQLEATANSTASLLGDLKAANTALHHTLSAESGDFVVRGNAADFRVTRRSD